MSRLTRVSVAAVAALSLAALTACGGNSDPLSSGGGSSSSDSNSIVVGSANFTEAEILGNVYAEALKANGFDVTTKLSIGSREAYVPAVKEGSIDVIPDYTGNLLQYLDPSATASSSSDVTAALPAALGSQLAISTPAPGEDKDAMVVTKATVERWNLKSIADLAAHESELKIGSTPEFTERVAGLIGLKDKYGIELQPGNYVSIADGGGPATVQALLDGQIDAADIYTTSPAIAQNDLVVLDDPENVFAAQNVVPLYNVNKKSDKLTKVLDAISAKITTDELLALNTEVSGDSKTEPLAAAQAWVKEQGLDQPVS
ncbi:ABC transporter substrate-binding protein [Actinomycetes bacterium M1A6_2h]